MKGYVDHVFHRFNSGYISMIIEAIIQLVPSAVKGKDPCPEFM